MSILEAIQLLKAYKGPLDLTLHKPASEELLSEVERVFGITLPSDFKTLYRFTDGFETEEDMFNMIPIAEIIDSKKRHNEEPFYFAEYMIYCDSWQLEINSKNNDEYDITVIDFEVGKILLTNSLGEFIRRFLSRGVFEIGGLYAWRDEIKAKLYGNTDPNKIKPLLWVFRECLKRGLMTKEDVVFRADWIIATEEEPHHFFIEMSLSHDLDELITVLTSINLTEDVMQVRAFFGQIDIKLSVDQITTDHAILILDNFSHDDRFTVYERNKMMGLIVEFDSLQFVKPMKQVKQQINENIKDFFHQFWNFNLYSIKSWRKINDDLVKKFESLESEQ
jgi:SMI1 / KNR4 family (SUKH-1)